MHYDDPVMLAKAKPQPNVWVAEERPRVYPPSVHGTARETFVLLDGPVHQVSDELVPPSTAARTTFLEAPHSDVRGEPKEIMRE
jgi:hypothetical protein